MASGLRPGSVAGRIVAGLEPQQPGSVELRVQIERMFTPALPEPSRLVSDREDTVIAPVLHRQREQMDQIAKTPLPPSSWNTPRRRLIQQRAARWLLICPPGGSEVFSSEPDPP